MPQHECSSLHRKPRYPSIFKVSSAVRVARMHLSEFKFMEKVCLHFFATKYLCFFVPWPWLRGSRRRVLLLSKLIRLVHLPFFAAASLHNVSLPFDLALSIIILLFKVEEIKQRTKRQRKRKEQNAD